MHPKHKFQHLGPGLLEWMLGLLPFEQKFKHKYVPDVGQIQKDAQRKIMQNDVMFASVALTATLFVANIVEEHTYIIIVLRPCH